MQGSVFLSLTRPLKHKTCGHGQLGKKTRLLETNAVLQRSTTAASSGFFESVPTLVSKDVHWLKLLDEGGFLLGTRELGAMHIQMVECWEAPLAHLIMWVLHGFAPSSDFRCPSTKLIFPPKTPWRKVQGHPLTYLDTFDQRPSATFDPLRSDQPATRVAGIRCGRTPPIRSKPPPSARPPHWGGSAFAREAEGAKTSLVEGQHLVAGVQK